VLKEPTTVPPPAKSATKIGEKTPEVADAHSGNRNVVSSRVVSVGPSENPTTLNWYSSLPSRSNNNDHETFSRDEKGDAPAEEGNE